jgi:hypothetical protein
MSAIERLRSATPAWSSDPAPEAIIRTRGAPPARRSYPVARNDRFIPTSSRGDGGADLENVGDGNDILIEDDRGNLTRVRRLKNVGDGNNILVDQQTGDEENKLRSLKVKAEHSITIEEMEEGLEFGTDGATAPSTAINIDGSIRVENGIVKDIIQGRRGGTGTLQILKCGQTSPETILEWENGQITTDAADPIILELGECNDPDPSGGGSFF